MTTPIRPLPIPCACRLQDRQFFETLYDFVARILFTCNERTRWHTIENELGRVFRSDYFNLARVRARRLPTMHTRTSKAASSG